MKLNLVEMKNIAINTSDRMDVVVSIAADTHAEAIKGASAYIREEFNLPVTVTIVGVVRATRDCLGLKLSQMETTTVSRKTYPKSRCA